jgi:hypothetical protein
MSNVSFLTEGYCAHKVIDTVAPNRVVKQARHLETSKLTGVGTYLLNVDKKSTILLSLPDIHGEHQKYAQIIGQVEYIKGRGFDDIIVLINGDLNANLKDDASQRRLAYACENLLLPLSGSCKLVFNLGNHDLQSIPDFFYLCDFLKRHNIPLLTHIPTGFVDWNDGKWDDMLAQCLNENKCDFDFLRRATFNPNLLPECREKNEASVSRIKTDNEICRELTGRNYGNSDKYMSSRLILGNTLIFPYCSSFLFNGGGWGCNLLKPEYRKEFAELHRGRNRDNLPESPEDNLITKGLKENFVAAMEELAMIPGPINLVIAAHEYYHPTNKQSDRVKGMFDFILKDYGLPADVLDRLSVHIACGHEHLSYIHNDATLEMGDGIRKKTIKCCAFGTDQRASYFTIVALKPQDLQAVAAPKAQVSLHARFDRTFAKIDGLLGALQSIADIRLHCDGVAGGASSAPLTVYKGGRLRFDKLSPDAYPEIQGDIWLEFTPEYELHISEPAVRLLAKTSLDSLLKLMTLCDCTYTHESE